MRRAHGLGKEIKHYFGTHFSSGSRSLPQTVFPCSGGRLSLMGTPQLSLRPAAEKSKAPQKGEELSFSWASHHVWLQGEARSPQSSVSSSQVGQVTPQLLDVELLCPRCAQSRIWGGRQPQGRGDALPQLRVLLHGQPSSSLLLGPCRAIGEQLLGALTE